MSVPARGAPVHLDRPGPEPVGLGRFGDFGGRYAPETLVDALVPGRSAEARGPNRAELAATMILAFPLGEASAKVRSGPPVDDPEDVSLPIWAGTVPLALEYGHPEAAPDVPGGAPVPPSVAGLIRRSPAP